MSEQPEHEHARGHITDSRFLGHLYATPTTRRVFCDVCRMQRWLDVEAALALSQGELGIVPPAAAERIAVAARVDRVDLEAVAADTRRTGHSLAALLTALERACDEGVGDFVHHGATTQDIQDTAQALEMREVIEALERALDHLVGELSLVAERHTATLMIARTHGQPALATTFGLKVAGWIDELLRHLERVAQAKPRILVAQLAGGVGTMAALGPRAPALVERFAERLGLGAPGVGWHASRDRIVEFVTLLATVTGTFGRIAGEVRTLTRPEVGELEVRWRCGEIASTTMPHKRNAGHCEQVVALAHLAAAQAPIAIGALLGEHERDGRTLRTEWSSVADVSHYALAAASLLGDLLDDCEAMPEAMAAHAVAAADALSTEALMFALAERVGKPRAYELVYGLSQAATEAGTSLRETLLASDALDGYLSADELQRAFDPREQLGHAYALVDGVVTRARTALAVADQSASSTRRSASNGDSRCSGATSSRRTFPV